MQEYQTVLFLPPHKRKVAHKRKVVVSLDDCIIKESGPYRNTLSTLIPMRAALCSTAVSILHQVLRSRTTLYLIFDHVNAQLVKLEAHYHKLNALIVHIISK